MKRFIVLLAALFIMGGVMAQNNGQGTPKEYISALLTFNSRQFPMDSLNAYGVVIQQRTGIIAYVLIPTENYQAFVKAGIAERVQPSSRVFFNEGQPGGPDNTFRPHPQGHDARVEHHPGNEAPGTQAPYVNRHCHHGNNPCHHQGRQHLIPDEVIDEEDARGCYLGILLGDSRNKLRVEQANFEGTWYPMHGIDAQLLLGYQFTRWFGLRTAAQFVNKNYATNLAVNGKNYETTYNNFYIQAPLLADFSLGGHNTRLHLMLGGYYGYWMTQYRRGFIYSPQGTTGTGYKNGFEEGYNEHQDAGAAAGLGLTFRLSPACLLHFEGTYYHGLLSTTADPNSTFNRTYTLDMGITYHF